LTVIDLVPAHPGCLLVPGGFPWDKLPGRGGIIRQRTAPVRRANSKRGARIEGQGVRFGAGSQNWSRASELEQGLRIGAASQNWSRASELEQGAGIEAGRRNWSRVTVGGEAGLQETTILSTSKEIEENCIAANRILSQAQLRNYPND